MLKFIFAFIVLVHGFIHLLGFRKAFNYGKDSPITMDISKSAGIFWLLTTLLFCAATLLFLLKKDSWWIITLSGAVISQLLICTAWHDAKFGSMANLIVLLMIVYYKIYLVL